MKLLDYVNPNYQVFLNLGGRHKRSESSSALVAVGTVYIIPSRCFTGDYFPARQCLMHRE